MKQTQKFRRGMMKKLNWSITPKRKLGELKWTSESRTNVEYTVPVIIHSVDTLAKLGNQKSEHVNTSGHVKETSQIFNRIHLMIMGFHIIVLHCFWPDKNLSKGAQIFLKKNNWRYSYIQQKTVKCEHNFRSRDWQKLESQFKRMITLISPFPLVLCQL